MASQPQNPVINLAQITDQYIRKNFEALDNYFKAQNQLLDFQFFEQSFTAAQTGVKVAHGLKYAPLDILVTHMTGTGKVTFQYGQFDTTYLIMDVSGPCRIRFFAGTCQKITSAVQTASSEAQAYTSGVS